MKTKDRRENLFKRRKIYLLLAILSFVSVFLFCGDDYNNYKKYLSSRETPIPENAPNTLSYFALLVGNDYSTTLNSTISGPEANAHINGKLKNTGDFYIEGKLDVSDEIFAPGHPIEALGEIQEAAPEVEIPVISPQDFLPKATFIFSGGEKNKGGYVSIYDEEGNLIEIVDGGSWKDPCGAEWSYNAGKNSWGITKNKPSTLEGVLYFETNFMNPAHSLTVRGGSVIVEGDFKNTGKMTIIATSIDEVALVSGSEVDFTNEVNIKGTTFIAGDAKFTGPLVIEGSLIVGGSVVANNTLKINYTSMAQEVALFIANDEFGEMEPVFSQVFEDVTERMAIAINIFKTGEAIEPIIDFDELVERAEAGELEGEFKTIVTGASLNYSPELIFYNGLPSMLTCFLEIKEKLIADYGYEDVRLTGFSYIPPMDYWGDVEADGVYIGTFLLNAGELLFRLTPEEKEAKFAALRATIEEDMIQNPEWYEEGAEFRKDEWSLYTDIAQEVTHSQVSPFRFSFFDRVSKWWLFCDTPYCMDRHSDAGWLCFNQKDFIYKGSYIGCGNVAAGMTLAYAGLNSVGRIVDGKEGCKYCRLFEECDWDKLGGKKCERLLKQLYIANNTHPFDIGLKYPAGETKNKDLAPGIKKVANKPGYGHGYSFNASYGNLLFTRWFFHIAWDLIKEEISNDRPLMICTVGHEDYKNHCMTMIGWGTKFRYLFPIYHYAVINTGLHNEDQPVEMKFSRHSYFTFNFELVTVSPGCNYQYEIDSIFHFPWGPRCPGDSSFYKVKLKNTGSSTWYNWGFFNKVVLGTAGFYVSYEDELYEIPKDHPSPFYACDWIDKNKVTTASESYVKPGDIGTFIFFTNSPPVTLEDRLQPLTEFSVRFFKSFSIEQQIREECDCEFPLFEDTLNCVCETNQVLCDFCYEDLELCKAWIGSVCPTTEALKGTPLEPEISTLRKFRDVSLSATDDGQFVIDTYYKYGPEIVTILFKDDNIKQMYRDLVAYFLPLVKESIAGNSDWSVKVLTPNEIIMLEDFNNALLPYASSELSGFLNIANTILKNYAGNTLSEVVNEMRGM